MTSWLGKCNNVCVRAGLGSAAVALLAVSASSRLLMAHFCSANCLMRRSQSAGQHLHTPRGCPRKCDQRCIAADGLQNVAFNLWTLLFGFSKIGKSEWTQRGLYFALSRGFALVGRVKRYQSLVWMRRLFHKVYGNVLFIHVNGRVAKHNSASSI